MSKKEFDFHDIKNYGIATIGERGQIVVPKEIRKSMKIKPGDKFLVFSKANKVIGLIKPENFDTIISEVMNKLKGLKNIKN